MATPIRVTVFRGPDQVFEEIFVRDLLKIGRLASAHVKLDDPAVGRIHAVLEASAGGYNLIDMGSPNGTRVNDAKVSRAAVCDGDIVAVGPYRLQLRWATRAEVEGRSPVPPAVITSDVEEQMMVSTRPSPPLTPSRGAEPLSHPGGAKSAPTTAPSDASDARPRSGSVAPWSARPATSVTPTSGTAPPWSAVPAPVASTEAPAARPAPALTPPAPPPAPASTGAGSVPPSRPPPAAAETSVHSVVPPESTSAWGTVPDNLASVKVPPTHRALEIRTIWQGDVVLNTLTVFDQAEITLGDERKVKGWGPFQTVERCDVEVPSRGLPAPSFVFAEALATKASEYRLNLPRGTTGHIERVNGTHRSLDDILRAGDATDPSFVSYELQAEETVSVNLGEITLQVRYVRRANVAPLPLAERVSYEYLNTFILVLFLHVVAIASFLATPQTQKSLEDDVYRAVNRFAQIRLTAEERRERQQNMLAQLKSGARAEKAAGKEGKAGRRDAKPDSRGRRAVEGKPDEKEQAQAALQKLFGSGGEGAVAAIFGGGGLGGELESALGGVKGARVGDQRGLGGLGLRGSGPGGGGTSYTTAGTGPLGTKGRGGGGSGDYGVGAGAMNEKKDRGVTIYTDKVTIRGSLPKDIIRRVIKQHLAQIRYCYEKELVRSPGIFGKVATQFIISGQGTVSSAKVAQSTLDNAAVERCITQKIRTWRFPKPKGGGIVVVKYPFVLKQSG